MEISRKSCRLCLTETDFNVSLYSTYGRRTNMVDKILVSLKIVIEEADFLNTICYRCAENVERYYDFVMFIKKSQTKLVEPQRKVENSVNRRLIASYVREQVYDADYTFSFLDNEEKKEPKSSSPFFSYFSPPNMLIKRTEEEPVWKTPKPRREDAEKHELRQNDKLKRQYKPERPRHHSRDLFESQSQDVEEPDLKPLDWKLTPDDNIIKRVRDKCFGRSDF
ncbi:hypothetical protein PYW08_010598 [Mythimna loreyi]|uniref:Uncharacterized protein n=1 Tax=Mythimna loreyi TaxID=667449 RepID=A0ACC2Q3M8_9NEOP|nr:hypothetical protein PYW08_010598 [Mythimna loreyi]